MKPRLIPCAAGWRCVGYGKEGTGRTARGAYFDWLNECAFYPYA